MSSFQRFKIFHKVASGVLIIFFGIMIAVTIIAYSKPSGYTGINTNDLLKFRQTMAENSLMERP